MALPIKSILIVDDEKPLARALELKLQHEGFQTTVAHDGQAGFDLVKDGDFDLLLLDLMMPVMDGFQVLEALQQLPEGHKRPQVIVLSNLSQHEDEARVRQLGATGYFVKSNTPLASIVDQIRQL